MTDDELIKYRVEQLEESVSLLAEALSDIVKEFSRAKWVLGTLLAGNITIGNTVSNLIKGALNG